MALERRYGHVVDDGLGAGLVYGGSPDDPNADMALIEGSGVRPGEETPLSAAGTVVLSDWSPATGMRMPVGMGASGSVSQIQAEQARLIGVQAQLAAMRTNAQNIGDTTSLARIESKQTETTAQQNVLSQQFSAANTAENAEVSAENAEDAAAAAESALNQAIGVGGPAGMRYPG